MDPDTLAVDGTISRRRLLVGAAVLTSALALGRGTFAGMAPGPLGRLAETDGPRLSVGYLAGLYSPAGLPVGARVLPAARLRRSAELPPGVPARVRLHGLTPGNGSLEDEVRGIDLDALLPAQDRTATAPLSFYAWTLRTGGHGGRSNPVTFAAELDEDPGLGFTLGVHRAVEGRPDTQRASVVLGATGRHGATVLRPGTYLLGVEPAGWDTPTALPPPADEAAWRELLSLVVTVQPVRR